MTTEDQAAASKPGPETQPTHLTFRTNDGARCFTDCPACKVERIQREDRANASRPYEPWMDDGR